jgi:hypothetical protein
MKDLEQNIVDAVRAYGLKMMLQDEEAAIRAQRIRNTRIRRLGWSSAAIVSIAALALVLLALPAIHHMQSYADAYAQSIREVGCSRGEPRLEGNELMLMQAAEAMAEGDWGSAEMYSEAVMTALEGSITSEDEQELYEQAEWYYALTLMHNGQYLKAQRLLRRIEQRQGIYAPQAAQAR